CAQARERGGRGGFLGPAVSMLMVILTLLPFWFTSSLNPSPSGTSVNRIHHRPPLGWGGSKGSMRVVPDLETPRVALERVPVMGLASSLEEPVAMTVLLVIVSPSPGVTICGPNS